MLIILFILEVIQPAKTRLKGFSPSDTIAEKADIAKIATIAKIPAIVATAGSATIEPWMIKEWLKWQMFFDLQFRQPITFQPFNL